MARNTSVYEVTVEGTTTEVATLKAVKELTGNKAVTTKAIMAGEVDGVILVEGTVEDSIKDTIVEKSGIDPDRVEVILVTDTPALTNTEDDTTALTNTEEVEEEESTEEVVDEPSDDQLEYPEVGTFDSEKAIKKYIKGLTNDQLAEWVELEGVEYKSNEHESINRMRQAMAIKALHFPQLAKTGGSTKKKAKYADYTTEALVEMALDNDVEVRDDKGDPRILRMYTIMALKSAGLIG